LRLGVFHRLLLEWAEKPCVLTVGIASVGSEVRIAGVLRSYFSLSSLQGWALVPPQQHGGFTAVQDYPWSPVAEEELSDHLRRLMEVPNSFESGA